MSPDLHHRIEWTIHPRWGIEGNVFCDAPPDAHCRTECAESETCREEGCTDPETHQRQPLGYCNPLTWWVEAGTLEELYDGEPTTLRDGHIVPVWDYDGCGWRYAEDREQIIATAELCQWTTNDQGEGT